MTSSPGGVEPFPALYDAGDHLNPLTAASGSSGTGPGSNGLERRTTRRRKSSGLGGEIRAGDTGVPAMATLDLRSPSPAGLKAQADRDRKKPFSKRRKARSWLRRFKHTAVKHTWFIPLLLLVGFGLGWLVNPTESNVLNHFFFLSYKQPRPADAPADYKDKYGKGYWDYAFVTFYVVVLSFTREFIMQRMLRPLALYAGLKSRAKQSRFMEQMYTAIYFGFTGPVGLWVMSHTPVWYFNIVGMYADFPHRVLEADFKAYYLFQAAYWAQQAIVLLLGMEKPRKDFKELVAHHIVSLLLIGLSYRFHFTHMGLAVYITHDISDFFLATSKCLNYIDHFLIGPYFGSFILIWIYLRHYLNLRIILSLFNEFKTVGPYELNWETQQYKCTLSFVITAFLLMSLQSLNLFWLMAILRIAFKFVFSGEAKDDRSDYEEEEDDLQDADMAAREQLKREATPTPPVLQLNGNTVEEPIVKATGTEKKRASRRKV